MDVIAADYVINFLTQPELDVFFANACQLTKSDGGICFSLDFLVDPFNNLPSEVKPAVRKNIGVPIPALDDVLQVTEKYKTFLSTLGAGGSHEQRMITQAVPDLNAILKAAAENGWHLAEVVSERLKMDGKGKTLTYENVRTFVEACWTKRDQAQQRVTVYAVYHFKKIPGFETGKPEAGEAGRK
jgi:hypothetical protein